MAILRNTEARLSIRHYDTPFDVSIDDPVVLTQTLVQINSASPDLGSVAGPGETAIACYIAAWLEYRGIETHWVESVKGRPSVVGVVRGSGGEDAKSLMLNGHIDTVTLMGYTDDPLSGNIVDGRLYGRGSADMKGGVAAAMVALINTRKLGLRGDVILTAVADEESQHIGTEDILRAGWRADAAIVSEPSNLHIYHAHKGYCDLEITFHGLAAHGSRADLGIDAIVNAGYFLAEYGRFAKRLHEGKIRSDKTLGTGTTHASLISGGEETSSYPAKCRFVGEWRTLPEETPEVVEKDIRKLLDKVASDIPDFKADFCIPHSAPGSFTPLDHPFTELVVDVVGKTLDSSPVVTGAPFWTDGAVLAKAGIVPLIWGPKGEGLHSKEEWVDVESIKTLAGGLARIAAEFCA